MNKLILVFFCPIICFSQTETDTTFMLSELEEIKTEIHNLELKMVPFVDKDVYLESYGNLFKGKVVYYNLRNVD